MIDPDWTPFDVVPRGQRPDAPRSIQTPEGIGDRLRAAAFAEIQAREAFRWAADTFSEVPSSLTTAWRGLALAEDRHLRWLLNRMTELQFDIRGRRVSDQLWVSLRSCHSAKEFAHYMASAEDRGRRAGERFQQAMAEVDPVSAEIFGKIAAEEVEHIALAERYFPRGEVTISGGSGDCTPLRAWNRVPRRGPEV